MPNLRDGQYTIVLGGWIQLELTNVYKYNIIIAMHLSAHLNFSMRLQREA